jgi:hypothetical protein
MWPNLPNLKQYIATGLAAMAILFGGFLWHRHNQKQDSQNLSETLAPGVDEKIIIDPIRRSLKIVKKTGVKTTTLPDRPTSLELLANDGIRINSPKWGTEMRPFLIASYDLSSGKLGGGLDLIYWNRFDLGLGFATNPSLVQDSTLFIGVSFFVWSNTSVMFGITNHTVPLLGIKVRL